MRIHLVDKLEVDALCDELSKLTGPAPGASPDALKRVEQIIQRFTPMDGGVGNVAREALGWFRIWFSPRKWQQYGDGQLRAIVNTSISTLRKVATRAIEDGNKS
jgi:hypothetical protein